MAASGAHGRPFQSQSEGCWQSAHLQGDDKTEFR